LRNWSVTDEGSFLDGVVISETRLVNLAIANHHSIRVRFGIKEDAGIRGGLDIFGRGSGVSSLRSGTTM